MIDLYLIHNIDVIEEAGTPNKLGVPSYSIIHTNIPARIEYVVRTEFNVGVQNIGRVANIYITSGYTIAPRYRLTVGEKYYEVLSVMPQYALDTTEEYIILECVEVTNE